MNMCICMYVHSPVVKKDLRLRHGAIVRVGKRQLIKKHSRNTGSARIAVCAGQWTMDMILQLIGYMYTYLMYTYVRSGLYIHIYLQEPGSKTENPF